MGSGTFFRASSLIQYCQSFTKSFDDISKKTDATNKTLQAVKMVVYWESELENSVTFLTQQHEPELRNATIDLIRRFNEVHFTKDQLRAVFGQIADTVHKLVRYVHHIQALAIRFELVRVIDEFVSASFNLHRAQLPDLLSGNLVQLSDGTLICRFTSQQNDKLRLAGEYIRDGERWLTEGCEPDRYVGNQEFSKLSTALLERLKRPRKLRACDKQALVDDFERLQEVMKQACEAQNKALSEVVPAGPYEEAELRTPEVFFVPYRENYEEKTLKRAECLVSKVLEHFGEYAAFLEFAKAAKDDRNGVLHAEAFCKLNYAQLQKRLEPIGDSRDLALLRVAAFVSVGLQKSESEVSTDSDVVFEWGNSVGTDEEENETSQDAVMHVDATAGSERGDVLKDDNANTLYANTLPLASMARNVTMSSEADWLGQFEIDSAEDLLKNWLRVFEIFDDGASESNYVPENCNVRNRNYSGDTRTRELEA